METAAQRVYWRSPFRNSDRIYMLDGAVVAYGGRGVRYQHELIRDDMCIFEKDARQFYGLPVGERAVFELTAEDAGLFSFLEIRFSRRGETGFTSFASRDSKSVACLVPDYDDFVVRVRVRGRGATRLIAVTARVTSLAGFIVAGDRQLSETVGVIALPAGNAVEASTESVAPSTGPVVSSTELAAPSTESMAASTELVTLEIEAVEAVAADEKPVEASTESVAGSTTPVAPATKSISPDDLLLSSDNAFAADDAMDWPADCLLVSFATDAHYLTAEFFNYPKPQFHFATTDGLYNASLILATVLRQPQRHLRLYQPPQLVTQLLSKSSKYDTIKLIK